MSHTLSIVVIGLGYVGLPLAVALAKSFEVRGLDVDARRIEQLRGDHDRTGEIDSKQLAESSLRLTSDPTECAGADIYIVTVPTPVDADKKPDLAIVLAATRTVGGLLESSRQQIVVYESTVYPGVTEDLCGPELERVSGLRCGTDFFLGYSPERINPGDREHTVDRITKVIAGQTPNVTDRLADIYGEITSGGVFRAKSIKAAEAAKVIENAQRDINIAFINEVACIFSKLDVSVWDVLAAANTKWNFLPFRPGLVGGHCIGIDPYYLAFCGSEIGHDPHVILAGRRLNDGMADWVAGQIHDAVGTARPSTLVLGLTFKEDVPDLRNSKVADLVAGLAHRGHLVTVVDPLADRGEAAQEYGVDVEADLPVGERYNAVVLAVPHAEYRALSADRVADLISPGGIFADLSNTVAPKLIGSGTRIWTF